MTTELLHFYNGMLTNKLKKKTTSEDLSKDLKELTKAGLDFISSMQNLEEDNLKFILGDTLKGYLFLY